MKFILIYITRFFVDQLDINLIQISQFNSLVTNLIIFLTSFNLYLTHFKFIFK